MGGGVVVGGVVGGRGVRVSRREGGGGVLWGVVWWVVLWGEGGVVDGWCCGRGRLWPIQFWPLANVSGPEAAGVSHDSPRTPSVHI